MDPRQHPAGVGCPGLVERTGRQPELLFIHAGLPERVSPQSGGRGRHVDVLLCLVVVLSIVDGPEYRGSWPYVLGHDGSTWLWSHVKMERV